MPSNKKKLSSTWPPMPSKESVKQELWIIAGALFKGSLLSGSVSFRIKTPALAALHDEEQFAQNSPQITNMSATVLSHHVVKLLNVHLTVHPGNMDPFTSNVWAVDHADEGQAFFCLGDQINIPEYFQGSMVTFSQPSRRQTGQRNRYLSPGPSGYLVPYCSTGTR